ncbi:hypothetical protein O3P69_017876 [Scylla paramamosain]|uniref:Regulatory protein zeste n=1 Tax=Scylla paramamosain TaxID=85552 RepID=A0AAW0TGP6_SCYPA
MDGPARPYWVTGLGLGSGDESHETHENLRHLAPCRHFRARRTQMQPVVQQKKRVASHGEFHGACWKCVLRGHRKSECRTLPLVGKQRPQLLALIQEREAILTSKASNPHFPLMRAKAWAEITAKFNIYNPGHEPRTIKQLRKSWDHIKRKMKADDLTHSKKVCKTGGGAPSPQPKFSEDEKMARALMSQDLAMPSQAKEFGQFPPLDEEGNPVLDVFISKIYLLFYNAIMEKLLINMLE